MSPLAGKIVSAVAGGLNGHAQGALGRDHSITVTPGNCALQQTFTDRQPMRANAGVRLGIAVWSYGLGVEEIQVCVSNVLGRRMEAGGQGLPRRQREVCLG